MNYYPKKKKSITFEFFKRDVMYFIIAYVFIDFPVAAKGAVQFFEVGISYIMTKGFKFDSGVQTDMGGGAEVVTEEVKSTAIKLHLLHIVFQKYQ